MELSALPELVEAEFLVPLGFLVAVSCLELVRVGERVVSPEREWVEFRVSELDVYLEWVEVWFRGWVEWWEPVEFRELVLGR